MHIINIRGIQLYAYHGCMPEESVIGGDYVVNVVLKGDFSKAMASDKLEDTADYGKVYQIVKREMGIRSNLIEHVAKRIAEHLKTDFPTLTNLTVEVIKKNPPVNGEVDEVSFVIEL